MQIEGIEIREKEDRLSLSDLQKAYIKKCVIENVRQKEMRSIFDTYRFRIWLENTFECDSKSGVVFLKEKQLYKTTGARDTKNVWVHPKIWEYVRIELFESIQGIKAYRFEDKFIKLVHQIFDGITDIEVQKTFAKHRVDLFFPEYDLCVEFDEKYHNRIKQEKEDLEREDAITCIAKVDFIRVKLGDEIKGINAILKYMYA